MLTLNHVLRHANLSATQYERIQPAAQAFGKAVHASFSPADEERILQALALMLALHGDQKPRPDSAPYIEHPLAVAAGVLDAMARKDPDLVVAALLHDTVEDQGAKLAQQATSQERAIHNDERELALAVIERLTHSRRVRDLVAGLSNPDFDALLAARGISKGTDEASRSGYTKTKNALYAEHVRDEVRDPEVALIKFFDFSTNALALDGIPDAGIRHKNARKYATVIDFLIDRLGDSASPLNLLPEKREALLARLLLGREFLNVQV